MLSRENKIIRDKIDGLQQLPDGYAPNLASKWEIIEAGLPTEKSKKIPLVIRWSAAAAVIAAMFFIGVKMNQHTAPSGLAVTASVPVNIINLPIEKKQIAVVVKNDAANNKLQKKQTILPEPIIRLMTKQEPVEDEMPKDWINEKADTVQLLNSELTTIIPQPEIPKRAKRRTYQKDFNDGQLVMDTGYVKASSQQFSFKLQLHQSTADDNQPARRLQLKQVL